MNPQGVNVICRKCKRSAPAEQFVMSLDDKIMVCPLCILDSRKSNSKMTNSSHKTTVVSPVKGTAVKKSADWDADDDYLERMNKQKLAVPKVEFIRIDAFNVKYTCPKCKYVFVYNEDKNHPKHCPFCTRLVSLKS
jgi:hypothetical protein